MACISNEALIAYNDCGLSPIEAAQVRDHMLLCPDCRRAAATFRALDMILATPTLHTPPARLVPQVMERLFPALPRYTSIIAVIAASLVFLVTWIYIYFDFSRSSLIQALQLTADGSSGWMANIVKGISAVYNASQAAFKAANALLNALLPAPLGTAFVAGSALALTALLAYLLSGMRRRKAHAEKT